MHPDLPGTLHSLQPRGGCWAGGGSSGSGPAELSCKGRELPYREFLHKKNLFEYCLNSVLQWDVCGGELCACIFVQVQRTDAVSKDNCTGSRNHPPGFETRWSQVIRPRHPLGCATDVFLRCLEGLHPVFETWRTAGPLGQALALSEGTSRVAGFEKRASR